ncbi:hypothetical protein B0H19DRAFT_1065743 [Mycena capillaripes]|nr:hypothetical protein B0H19DRAFT_1065743 [Mycena capillaripes]
MVFGNQQNVETARQDGFGEPDLKIQANEVWEGGQTRNVLGDREKPECCQPTLGENCLIADFVYALFCSVLRSNELDLEASQAVKASFKIFHTDIITSQAVSSKHQDHFELHSEKFTISKAERRESSKQILVQRNTKQRYGFESSDDEVSGRDWKRRHGIHRLFALHLQLPIAELSLALMQYLLALLVAEALLAVFYPNPLRPALLTFIQHYSVRNGKVNETYETSTAAQYELIHACAYTYFMFKNERWAYFYAEKWELDDYGLGKTRGNNIVHFCAELKANPEPRIRRKYLPGSPDKSCSEVNTRIVVLTRPQPGYAKNFPVGASLGVTRGRQRASVGRQRAAVGAAQGVMGASLGASHFCAGAAMKWGGGSGGGNGGAKLDVLVCLHALNIVNTKHLKYRGDFDATTFSTCDSTVFDASINPSHHRELDRKTVMRAMSRQPTPPSYSERPLGTYETMSDLGVCGLRHFIISPRLLGGARVLVSFSGRKPAVRVRPNKRDLGAVEGPIEDTEANQDAQKGGRHGAANKALYFTFSTHH